MKEFNCMWSHNCGDKKICCHFCHEKSCEWRCYDDPRSCRYKCSDSIEKYIPETTQIKVDELKGRSHNEIVDNNLRRKLREYRSQNKLKIESFANIVGIERQTFQRVLSDLPIVKLRTATYEKLKEFVKNI